MPAARDDRCRLEALRGFTRLLASETGVEPLSRLILDALAGAVGRPSGVLYGPADADGAREVLASRDPTPPPGSAARAGELRIPLALAGEEVAVAVLGDRVDVDGEGDSALVREMAVQAAAALRAALTVREAQRLAAVSRAVLDAVPDGVGLVDDRGRVVLRNDRLVQLSRAVPPLPLAAVKASDGPTADEFQVQPTRQRLARYTEPVCDPAGERLGRVIVLRDITREHDVEQRKDELMATIAHELRGPLAVISGFVELLSTRAASEEVTVTVADPGLGIPSEDQPRIFERFYRSNVTHRREIEGSGLGLSLCRQIVLAHGGTLDFHSVSGQGSRFWFTLPRPAEQRIGVSAGPLRG